jgi:hypothetical protein
LVFGLGAGEENIWWSGSIVAMKKEELRARVREEREREWIRDSLMLRAKKPEDTVMILFDLCEFTQKLARNQR